MKKTNLKESDYKWSIWCDFGHGHGYEKVCDCDDKADKNARMKEYRENDPKNKYNFKREVKEESKPKLYEMKVVK